MVHKWRGDTAGDGNNPPDIDTATPRNGQPARITNTYRPSHDPMRRTARTQAAMVQGGDLAVGQAATERDGTIDNGTDGRGDQQQPNILLQLMAANGHSLPAGQDGIPTIESIFHCIWTEDELREVDSLLHQFTDTDRKLQSVYDDTVHTNDGLHLSGGIDPAEDRKMQRLHH